MKLTHNIDSFIKKHDLIKPGMKIVVGLSGGPDSVFLLRILSQRTDISLIAAHLDHQWRTNSGDDVAFCKQFSESLNIPFISRAMNDFSNTIKYNGSREEFGRQARRAFFEKVIKEHAADAIALAHHLDDQQETCFIRLIRGTSLAGLTAMRPRMGAYIRPLLDTKKVDIVHYLDTHKIPYVIDPTNESQEFLRNRIRSTVIPALRDCDARFDANFLATIHRLQDIEQFFEQLTRERFEEISQNNSAHVMISLSKFHAQPSTMQYRLIVEWLTRERVPFPATQAFLDEMIRFLQQPGSKQHTIHEAWKIVKKRDLAWLDR